MSIISTVYRSTTVQLSQPKVCVNHRVGSGFRVWTQKRWRSSYP
jgi:hypothetical protein